MDALEEPLAVLCPESLERQEARRQKRGAYFLKGPIRFDWMCANIPDPTSRVVLVARAFMDMSKSDQCVLNAKVWDCAGVHDRYQRRRVLARLRKLRGEFEVEDRVGRPSVLSRGRTHSQRLIVAAI
jgi:hypothetical protein